MLVCRWVTKFLQLFILKLLVMAALLILCASRSTDSQCDSEILLTFTSQLHCCHSRVCVPPLLSVCNKKEEHPVIQFLWAEGVPGTKIHCQTFNTIWKQCFTAAKFVQMDNCVQKQLHKCHWWRMIRMPVYIHYGGKHSMSPFHDSG
jgi:hypothetical protein